LAPKDGLEPSRPKATGFEFLEITYQVRTNVYN